LQAFAAIIFVILKEDKTARFALNINLPQYVVGFEGR